MRWTDEQQRDIARRYREGEGLRVLSIDFRTSDRQVKAVLGAHGVALRKTRHTPQPLTANEARAVCERYAGGQGIDAIAGALHLSANRVKDALIAAGIAIRSVNARKFDHFTESAIARRYADGEGASVLAVEYGCAVWTIREIARRKGLVINPRGNRYREFSNEAVAEMARMWHAGESQEAIARHVGSTQIVISRVLRQHGIAKKGPAQGARVSGWKGGRVRAGVGRIRTGEHYWQVLVPPDHPLAVMRGRSGYILEHRLVMAEQLGRPLTKHETIHHVNGDKSDNRPENLQLRNGRHGNGTTYRCADCGSYHIIAEPIASHTED